MFCTNYEEFVSGLEQRGYIVHGAANGAEAVETVCALIGSASVGCGNSMTVESIGLIKALSAQGAKIFYHGGLSKEEAKAVYPLAHCADWYLTSTNAISRDGSLVNIDGTGNRVAGMFAGPERVALVIGKNKLTDDVASALKRVRETAAPINAKRFGKHAPCMVGEPCVRGASKECICKVTSIIDKPTSLVKEMHLILVDEALGY